MSRRWMWLALAFVGVAACDSKPKEPPPDIVKSQRQALDKAKAAEQILQKSADERRKQADEQK
ncbi:MAG: hypothetical protein ACREVS_03285 [Burkholderiales bacterium]